MQPRPTSALVSSKETQEESEKSLNPNPSGAEWRKRGLRKRVGIPNSVQVLQDLTGEDQSTRGESYEQTA